MGSLLVAEGKDRIHGPCFLDEGAEASILEESLAEKLCKFGGVINKESPPKLRSFDKKIVTATGTMMVKLKLGHEVVEHEFIVTPTAPAGCVVGLDLQLKFHLKKDLFNLMIGFHGKSHQIPWVSDRQLMGLKYRNILAGNQSEFNVMSMNVDDNGEKPQLNTCPSIADDQYQIQLMEDVILKPGERKAVRVFIDELKPELTQDDVIACVEPFKTVAKDCPVLVANSVAQLARASDCCGTYAEVFNYSKLKQKIKRFSYIGTCHLVQPDSIEQVPRINSTAVERKETPMEEGDEPIDTFSAAEEIADIKKRYPHLANIDFSNSILNEEQQRQLMCVLVKVESMFAKHDYDLGLSNMITYHIETGDAPPVVLPPRRIPYFLRPEAERQINELEKAGLIRRSYSPYASPIVMSPKKDGTWRLCVDFRALNENTKADSYPVPRADELIYALAEMGYLSIVDLLWSFHNIPMAAEDIEKTAFRVPWGHWEWLRVPFGLKNSGAAFCKAMDLALAGLQWIYCLAYIDDVLIFSKTFEDHLLHIESVMTRLMNAGFKLKAKKCKFATKEMEFLGHLITPEGIKPNPKKIEVINSLPAPTTVKLVQQFLGMANYYKKFIPGYSIIVKPIVELIKKGVKFIWSDACQKAFDIIKQLFTNAPLLRHPDFQKDFFLSTDASKHGIACVLEQDFEENGQIERHPVCFGGRMLSKSEQNYDSTNLEGLAIRYALDQYKVYLQGRPFTLYTDNSALTWILKKGKSEVNANQRLIRWVSFFDDFKFVTTHRTGKSNVICDYISRACSIPPADLIKEIYAVRLRDRPLDTCGVRWLEHIDDPIDLDDLRTKQYEDKFCNILKDFLMTGVCDPNLNEKQKNSLRAAGNEFIIGDNELVYHIRRCSEADSERPLQYRVFVPEPLRLKIMRACHDALFGGVHGGFRKTFDKVSSRFYWLTMRKDTKDYVESCQTCARFNRGPILRRLPLKPMQPGDPWMVVGIDLLGFGKMSRNGNNYVLTVIDYLTRWAEALPIPNKKATTITNNLDLLFSRFGCPKRIHSDNALEFCGSEMKTFCEKRNIVHTTSTAYHPAGNGLVENVHKTILSMVRKYVNRSSDNWDELLPALMHGYRITIQRTLGDTPFYMMLLRDPYLPIEMNLIPFEKNFPDLESFQINRTARADEAMRFARHHILFSQAKQKKYFDEKNRVRPWRIEPGCLVWKNVTKQKTPDDMSWKLKPKWEGPFRVVADKELSNTAKVEHEYYGENNVDFDKIIIRKPNANSKPKTINKERLMPFRKRPDWAKLPAGITPNVDDYGKWMMNQPRPDWYVLRKKPIANVNSVEFYMFVDPSLEPNDVPFDTVEDEAFMESCLCRLPGCTCG